MSLISIVLPVYNVEPYIERCLQSVAAQFMTEGIECILVDDCGTDRSIEVAGAFISGYQGKICFRLLHHEHNRGLSAARNTGIRASQGKYVYFLDSDDTITADCMEGFLNIIKEHPDVDLIQGLIGQDSPYMNQFTTKEFPSYTDDCKYIKKALLDYNELPVCAANKMVRRQLIIDHDLFFKEGIIHEDNYWSYFLAKYVCSLAIYPKKCYLYTENPISITKAVNRNKEIYSSKVIIEDFCNNIDNFLKGEQKTTILNYLSGILHNHFYGKEEQRSYLFRCLYCRCNILERLALWLWFMTKDTCVFKNKLFNLCVFIFRLLI